MAFVFIVHRFHRNIASTVPNIQIFLVGQYPPW
jgi:YfiH family protein